MCHGGSPTITFPPCTWLCCFPVSIELQLLIKLALIGRLNGGIVTFTHIEYLGNFHLQREEAMRRLGKLHDHSAYRRCPAFYLIVLVHVVVRVHCIVMRRNLQNVIERIQITHHGVMASAVARCHLFAVGLAVYTREKVKQKRIPCYCGSIRLNGTLPYPSMPSMRMSMIELR